MFNFCQIIAMITLWMLISSKIKHKLSKNIFVIVVGLYSVMEIVAVNMTGSLIDYRFYYHLNRSSFEGSGFKFNINILLFSSLFLLICSLIHYFSELLKNYLRRCILFIPVAVTVFLVLIIPRGVFSEKQKICEILNSEEKSFSQALIDLGIPPDEYVTPDQLTANKGKNIIVISVESLEQGFLGENFGNIAPHLRALSKEWTYYDQMSVGPGGGWTAASLYKYQVGMPAFFKGQGNDFFQGTTSVKLTGLGHVLEKAGYKSIYLAGNPEFAGMANILRAYGIDVVSEKNSLGKYPPVPYGFNDYDLFQEAKLQVEKLSDERPEPFALFISTINTHFPNGIFDKRMEKFVPKNTNTLEFSISAIDYLIDDFISYLKDNKILKNTVVFIFPDHLLMGNGGDALRKLKESKRRLYVITNANEENIHKKTSDPLYQVDLPRVIVDGAGIETNARFLRDFINIEDVSGFLENNRVKITALNSASLSKNNYMDGIEISASDGEIILRSNTIKAIVPINENQNDMVCQFTFNTDMVLIEHKFIHKTQSFVIGKKDSQYRRKYLLVQLEDGNIKKTYFGNKKMLGVFKNGEKINYNRNEISSILGSSNATQDNLKDLSSNQGLSYKNIIEATLYAKDTNRFIAHAGGSIDGYSYTNSLEALTLSYRNGFRLFELDIVKTADGKYVAAHDWKHWAKISGYWGDLPPSREIFMQHRIYEKYTPMDLPQINAWFNEHPDAILVTDKINTPIDFSHQFLDKKRLMMELFTWEAVREAIGAGIRSAMPTGSLINTIKGDKVAYLTKLGITDIACSRRKINSEAKLFEKFVQSGIHIYAYQINHDKGKDETYVVCNERDSFYGMYADKWDFSAMPDCSEY